MGIDDHLACSRKRVTYSRLSVELAVSSIASYAANKVSRVLPDDTSSDNSPGGLTNDSDEEEDIVKICELYYL